MVQRLPDFKRRDASQIATVRAQRSKLFGRREAILSCRRTAEAYVVVGHRHFFRAAEGGLGGDVSGAAERRPKRGVFGCEREELRQARTVEMREVLDGA